MKVGSLLVQAMWPQTRPLLQDFVLKVRDQVRAKNFVQFLPRRVFDHLKFTPMSATLNSLRCGLHFTPSLGSSFFLVRSKASWFCDRLTCPIPWSSNNHRELTLAWRTRLCSHTERGNDSRLGVLPAQFILSLAPFNITPVRL